MPSSTRSRSTTRFAASSRDMLGGLDAVSDDPARAPAAADSHLREPRPAIARSRSTAPSAARPMPASGCAMEAAARRRRARRRPAPRPRSAPPSPSSPRAAAAMRSIRCSPPLPRAPRARSRTRRPAAIAGITASTRRLEMSRRTSGTASRSARCCCSPPSALPSPSASWASSTWRMARWSCSAPTPPSSCRSHPRSRPPAVRLVAGHRPAAGLPRPGAVGIAIERGIIRLLYGRPLETLLATWGLSLILQQAVRTIFGPTNREVGNPSWMSGAFELGGLAITWNRLWIVVFALAVFVVLLLVLKRTALRPADARRHAEPPHGLRHGHPHAMGRRHDLRRSARASPASPAWR